MIPFTSYAVEIGAAAEIMYFNYEEFDTAGDSLDEEKGYLPGLTLSASHAHQVIIHTVEFSAFDGEVDYDGQTQSGIPHKTDSEATIYRALYKISWSPENTEGELYAKAYWQQWDRDIQPNNNVFGLFERYEWWSFEAGVQAFIYKKDQSSLFMELGVLKTLNGTIEIDLNNFGFGMPTLDLGDETGFNSALKYKMNLSQNSSLALDLRFTHFGFARSNTKTISNRSSTITIVEPESVTKQATVSVGYIYNF